jgi:hypothetical protein
MEETMSSAVSPSQVPPEYEGRSLEIRLLRIGNYTLLFVILILCAAFAR